MNWRVLSVAVEDDIAHILRPCSLRNDNCNRDARLDGESSTIKDQRSCDSLRINQKRIGHKKAETRGAIEGPIINYPIALSTLPSCM